MSISNERGAVVVLVAVMLFLIFFCVALVVDIGHIHNVKIELQRAVDAAALAGAQEIPAGPAKVVTTAVAMGAANQVDNDAVTIKEGDVVTGWWESKITTGQTASDRFDRSSTKFNAVQVTAKLNVPHFFFFPDDDGTDVTADAIAVYQTINPVSPLAMIACTTSTGQSFALPDMTITGITTFEFAANDLGAWTSLTFSPANTDTINDLIVDPDKLDNFNRVIYGKNLDNDGIENTAVSSSVYPYNRTTECKPNGTNIPCGLGRIADKEIATPEEFLEVLPPNLVNLDQTSGNYAPTAFDPLTDFGSWKNASGNRTPGVLPRWYNLNDESGLQSDDYFARILTQDGILLNSQTHLEGYYKGLDPAFGDDRFKPYDKNLTPNGGDLIKYDNSKKIYLPNYAKILQLAGYPQVYLTNGVSNALIANFLEKIGAQNGSMSCSEIEDDIFPATQQALILKTPVIYVGDCDDVSFTPSETYNYVGLAKFLVTRIWANGNCYFCPDSDLQDENRPGAFQVEGLQILPVADREETNASLIRIYLVE